MYTSSECVRIYLTQTLFVVRLSFSLTLRLTLSNNYRGYSYCGSRSLSAAGGVVAADVQGQFDTNNDQNEGLRT